MSRSAKFYTDIRVRYQETDKMGVAYHGNYLTWFEVARVDMLDQLNIPYIKMEERGFMLPVIEIFAKYHRPCFYDDRLKIETIIKEEPRIKIRVDYQITRAHELICEGYSLHAFIDNSRKICRPPEEFTNTMANIFSTGETS